MTVNFFNLSQVKSLEYVLTYESNGNEQGVTGSIDTTSGSSLSRELVFGTASSGVYTYHSNIKNMKLEVNVVLKSGKKFLKRYRVRV